MKKVILALFAIAFIFSFDVSAFADEGHSHDQNNKMNQEDTNHEDMNHKDMDHEDMNHEDMNHDDLDQQDMNHESESHSDAEGTHSSGDSEGGHEAEAEGGGHGHGPVVETPPNYKILGTYGAVNLAFILIGIWNKWFRRRVNY